MASLLPVVGSAFDSRVRATLAQGGDFTIQILTFPTAIKTCPRAMLPWTQSVHGALRLARGLNGSMQSLASFPCLLAPLAGDPEASLVEQKEFWTWSLEPGLGLLTECKRAWWVTRIPCLLLTHL